MSERNIFTGLYWSNDKPHMSFFDENEREVNQAIIYQSRQQVRSIVPVITISTKSSEPPVRAMSI